MPNLTLKWKIIIIVFLGGILIFFFQRVLNDKPKVEIIPIKPTSQANPANPNDPPKIISTKPDPLEDNIISATEVVEISFNRPLENVGEFKSRIEPKIDYKAELSSDRKTAKIIPAQPYQLGTTYTLFIGTETKFDGVGRWGQEKIYHFRTIKYTGV